MDEEGEERKEGESEKLHSGSEGSREGGRRSRQNMRFEINEYRKNARDTGRIETSKAWSSKIEKMPRAM